MTKSHNELSTNNGSHEITRREAVAWVGAAGAAGILLIAPSLAFALDDGDEETSKIEHNKKVHAMTHEDWKKHIDQEFLVTGQTFSKKEKTFKKKTAMKLVDVDNHKHESDKERPKEIRAAGISLVFEAPVKTNLDNKTHTIVHPKLGTFQFLLHEVPRGKDHKEFKKNKDTKQFYEAVLN